jgi:hypothetical protein
MVDKKNIVIKVKYPNSSKKIDDLPVSKVITEWNIKRISFALLGVVSFIVFLFYILKQDTEHSTVVITPKVVEPVVNAPVKQPDADLNKNVSRALLTYKITNDEPAEKLELPLKFSKNKPTSVYYFVELTGMKGKTIYHEWLLENELITRKKVNVSKDLWPTSSRQLFGDSTKTNWTARLVDETGQVINEIRFNAIYE